MIYLFIKSFFLGFGIWSIFLMLAGEKVNPFYKALDDSAVVVVRIAGIALVIIWIDDYYHTTFNSWSCNRFYGINSMSETYMTWCWLYIITYIGTSQIVWFWQVKNSSILRFWIAGVLLLVMHLELLMMMFTSYRRDFFPPDWMLADLKGNLFYHWGINLGIFMCMLIATYLIKKTIMK